MRSATVRCGAMAALGFLSICALLGIPGIIASPVSGESIAAPSLHVVGGPIAAGASVIVITVNPDHTLDIAGVNPRSDTVEWQSPYSASEVTAGVALEPFVIGTTVLVFTPSDKSSNPVVTISGVNASSGATEWTVPGSYIVSDIPAISASGKDFCVTTVNTDGTTSVELVNATTGSVDHVLSGPFRQYAQNLYETDAQTLTFEQLSPTGAPAWIKSVASVFGNGYSSNNGWNMNVVGGLDVGSVAPVSHARRIDMAANKTVGFATSNGQVEWTIGGTYMCMGPLEFLSTQVACQYSGSIKEPTRAGTLPSLRGVSLKLVGFNPLSGSIEWTLPVRNVKSLSYGDGVKFESSDELDVQLSDGKSALLDTATGAVATLKKGQILWCETSFTYAITTPTVTQADGKRVSPPVYYPCTDNGRPSSKAPPSLPSSVGVTADGEYVWASPDGLRTQAVGKSASS